jgi:alkane 1-monooxygenase
MVAGHELIHRKRSFQRAAGGLLLATVAYGSFKIEHIRGHHVCVATPDDPSSAPRGLDLYRFLLRAVPGNIARAWRLEAQRLRAQGTNALGPRNEFLLWTITTLSLAAGILIAYGGRGLVFFVVQCLVAIWLLETINYVEHYGLRRYRRPDGRYERVTADHSWDAPFLWSNWFLLNLQRHPDHHLHAAKPYQLLDHHPESPQLPGPYSAMIVLAHIPWLWTRVMDPRLPARMREGVAVTPDPSSAGPELGYEHAHASAMAGEERA